MGNKVNKDSKANQVNLNHNQLVRFLMGITYSIDITFSEGEIYEAIMNPKDNKDFILVKHPSTEQYYKVAKFHEGRLFEFVD